ncbi:MAG: DEAD/DEAH box helicase [Ornithinimicrobium sp.]
MAPQYARSGAPQKSTKPSGKKKPRHSSAQKKAARIAREQSERAARRAKEGKKDDQVPAARRQASPAARETPRRSGSPARSEHSPRRRSPGGTSAAPAARGGASTRRPSSKERAAHEAQRPERRPRTSTKPQVAVRPASAAESQDAGKHETAVKPEVTASGVSEFASLGLDASLVAALARQGITVAFPIQQATIPDSLSGRDVLGRGQTGSGKTLAFGLPMLHRLQRGEPAAAHRPRALILTPTRELAMQIVDALGPLASTVRLRHQLIAGGMPYAPQLRSLEHGVDILVATPGRLSDLIERGAVDLSEISITVLDEADHMAEMGFVEAINDILDRTPSSGQRLLFSATLDHGVDKIAARFLHDPVTHSTESASASVATMAHHLFLVHPHEKKTITAAIANRTGRTVVFVRTKLGADRVAIQLRESGVFAAALHGGLNQAQRTRVLAAFKSGELPVLVATDVAARGIHVDDVSLVLQADPPADHKDYLHRSGRTARAGRDGAVVTLALPHQRKPMQRLLDMAGVSTEATTVGPADEAVITTAGGSMPSGEPVTQQRMDAVLRPSRSGQGARRGPGGRGPGGRGQGNRRFEPRRARENRDRRSG